MQVLLNQDVKPLGYRGDIVNVKNGYFRNFLYPRGLAQVATDNVVALSEGRNEKRVMKKQQVVDNAKDVLAKLKGLSVVVKAKVNEKGNLYSAVSEDEIIESIKNASNVQLEKDFLVVDPIKDLGEHKVKITLGKDLEEEITVQVEAL